MSYVVYDLETTGLDRNRCEIVQFAYAKFDENNMLIKAETLYFYHDGMHWDEEVARISHKLSLDFLKQYKDKFDENIIKMWTVLNGETVIGHNSIDFDGPFAKTWLGKQGLTGLTFAREIDTMVAFRPITKRARIKLVKLGEMIGITEDTIQMIIQLWFGTSDNMQAHNAAYDVTLIALITQYGIRKGLISILPKVDPALEDAVENPLNDVQEENVKSVIDPSWIDKYHAFICAVNMGDGIHYFKTSADTGNCSPEEISIEEHHPEKYVGLSEMMFPYIFTSSGLRDIYSVNKQGVNFVLDLSDYYENNPLGVLIDNGIGKMNTNMFPVRNLLHNLQATGNEALDDLVMHNPSFRKYL